MISTLRVRVTLVYTFQPLLKSIQFYLLRIDSYNDYPTNGIINLKGFAVGNGCTHPDECSFNSEIPRFLF